MVLTSRPDRATATISPLWFKGRSDLVHQFTNFVSVDPSFGAFLDTHQAMLPVAYALISPVCWSGIKIHHFTSHQHAALSRTGDRVGVGCPRVILHPRLRAETSGGRTRRGKYFEVCQSVRGKPDNDSALLTQESREEQTITFAPTEKWWCVYLYSPDRDDGSVT